MLLPYQIKIEEIDAICACLADRPAGAARSEFPAAIGNNDASGLKLSACILLGFISKLGNKRIRITGRGRNVARGKGWRTKSFREAISDFPAYEAAMMRAESRKEFTITTPEVVSHWLEDFPSGVSEVVPLQRGQTACFFRLLQAANMGKMKKGTHRRETRFNFNAEELRRFVRERESPREADTSVPSGKSGTRTVEESEREQVEVPANSQRAPAEEAISRETETEAPPKAGAGENRIYIAHRGNAPILHQLRELLAFGQFEAVATRESGTSEMTMTDMRSCKAAVMHAGADRMVWTENGQETRHINENTLIEFGVALALYGRNVILLVEEGVELPTALQGIRKCHYSGSEMDGPSIMTLLKTLNDLDFG